MDLTDWGHIKYYRTTNKSCVQGESTETQLVQNVKWMINQRKKILKVLKYTSTKNKSPRADDTCVRSHLTQGLGFPCLNNS